MVRVGLVAIAQFNSDSETEVDETENRLIHIPIKGFLLISCPGDDFAATFYKLFLQLGARTRF